MNRPSFLGIGVLLILSSYGDLGAQGYAIRDDRVVIDRAEEWRSWSFPVDIVEISEEGCVRPRRIRRDIDAVEDIAEFGGGILWAGSNAQNASNVLDGDRTTYWEPDPQDPLETWWMEIDLGRLVSATEVTLRFSEEGDPFLLFDVLGSSGWKAFAGSDRVAYSLIGRTTRLNKEQRTFRYELPNRSNIQYIRIEATARADDQAEEVTEAEYARLSRADQGAILYFVEMFPGEETPVAREEYDRFPPEERGVVRYYRRERPRLSEVSVRSVGDNVGLGILDRGGSITGSWDATKAFDGSATTGWRLYRYVSLRSDITTLMVDLGAGFWIDEVRTSPWLLVKGSEGTRSPYGDLVWTTLLSPSLADMTPIIISQGGWEMMQYYPTPALLESTFPRRKATPRK